MRAQVVAFAAKERLRTIDEPAAQYKFESGKVVYYIDYKNSGEFYRVRKMAFEDGDTSMSRIDRAKSFDCGNFTSNGFIFVAEDFGSVLEFTKSGVAGCTLGSPDKLSWFTAKWNVDKRSWTESGFPWPPAPPTNSGKLTGFKIAPASLKNDLAVVSFPKDEQESLLLKATVSKFAKARSDVLDALANATFDQTEFASYSVVPDRKERLTVTFWGDRVTLQSVTKYKFTDRLDGLEDLDSGFEFRFDKDGNLSSFKLRNQQCLRFFPDLKPDLYWHVLSPGRNYEVKWSPEGALEREGIRDYPRALNNIQKAP